VAGGKKISPSSPRHAACSSQPKTDPAKTDPAESDPAKLDPDRDFLVTFTMLTL